MYNYVKWRNICYFMYMIMFYFENAEIKTNKQTNNEVQRSFIIYNSTSFV